MDDDDQRQKELSISLAASSMINGSDMIPEESYRANLKRIQEVREMVRTLEVNNESGHRNYVVHQLEKRAKDGRDAEVMLAQYRNQAGFDKTEVIIPTTATLVEVPETQSAPYSSPVATTSPQVTQKARPGEYRWKLPTQVHQAQSNPNVVPYYTVQPQYGAVSRSQAPINGQMGWYATQNAPQQSRVHNPPSYSPSFQQVQAQQPSQPWNSHSSPVGLPAGSVPVPGHYAFQPGCMTAAPTHSGSNISSTYFANGFQTQSTAVHKEPENLSSLSTTTQVPPHSVPLSVPPVQSRLVPSHPKPVESQSQPLSVSKPVAISEFQRLHELQPLRQLESQPPPRPQQPQRLPQSLPQLPRSSQEHPPRLVYAHTTMHPTRTSQTLGEPFKPGVSQAQPSQPNIVQEHPGTQPHVSQVMFIKLFQIAAQRGVPHLKAFFAQAKASRISDEWFRAAINSLPRDIWESVVAQANQAGSTHVTPALANISQQSSTISASNMPVARPSSSSPRIAQTMLATEEHSIPAKGRSVPPTSGDISGSYVAQLQYYAEQATKLALSAQMPNTSATPPGNIPSIQNIIATPTRDASQAQVNVRTPKDANKSTLARDILRSLGKIAPKQEMAVESADKTDNHEDGRLPKVNIAERITVSPKLPTAKPARSLSCINSPSMPSTEPAVQVEPQDNAQSAAESALRDDRREDTVVGGPIMIDLTLEDSDAEREPTFPIQISAGAATSPHPVSPANTTNHTLSLADPQIGAATEGDVHMCSPPLSLDLEENMGSGLLYPPLGSAELVPLSFELLPHEENEHPLDGQLPLFLPSPPLSLAHTEPPETDLETMSNNEGKSGPFLKRRSVDVEGMEIDTTPSVRKRRKQQVYVLIPPAPPYVKKAIKRMKECAIERDKDSDAEGAGEDEEIQYSHLEQLLIEESKSRLLERRCQWLNCCAVLNCSANLFAHLKNHAREDSQFPFHCRWASCQRQFDAEQGRDVHFERHTTKPLPCPFADCDEQFNKPVEVMQHEVQHQKEENREPLKRKSRYRPIVPAIPARLGPPPNRLPSHRVIPRRVVKCRISADRHAIMGPWILWNIFSPVDLNTRKQNGSMRGRQARQGINYDVASLGPRRDEYDFLVALSSYSAKIPRLDDLDSTLITMSAAQGLTLWGSGSAVNSAARAVTPEECRASAAEEGRRGDGESRADEGRSGQSVVMGEEDAVERMLIL